MVVVFLPAAARARTQNRVMTVTRMFQWKARMRCDIPNDDRWTLSLVPCFSGWERKHFDETTWSESKYTDGPTLIVPDDRTLRWLEKK